MTTYDFDNLPDWINAYHVPTAADEFRSWISDLSHHGTSGGLYMPAVTYYDARQTMRQHGDEVWEYIYEQWGDELPYTAPGMSYGQMCCHWVSMAVQLWAGQVCAELGID